MKIVKNEKGLTLIEVLATLAIMSLLIGLGYGVFINGLNYSSKAQDITALQQEANYVLTVLNGQQEKQDAYTVSVSPDHKTIMITNPNNSQSEGITIENPLFRYDICEIDDNTDQCIQHPDPNNPIVNFNDTSKESFHVKVVITKVGSDLTYEVQTILSRL